MDDDAFDEYNNEESFETELTVDDEHQSGEADTPSLYDEAFEEEGELAVDVYHDNGAIIVQAMTAGVRKGDLDISITRETVTIQGTRSEEKRIHDDGYFHRELYWGSFSRTIHLPEEIDVEEAHAKEEHGLLTITLPLIDKDREAKLKVK
jgi:HSP20 family protein